MSNTHEEKFERVEEHKLDRKHGTEEIRVASDTGKGDPALNFQPTDVTLVRLCCEFRLAVIYHAFSQVKNPVPTAVLPSGVTHIVHHNS